MTTSFKAHRTTSLPSKTSDTTINPSDAQLGRQLAAIIPIAKSARREVQTFFSELYDTEAVPPYAIALLPIFTETFAGHIFVLLFAVMGWLQGVAFDLQVDSTLTGEALFIPKEYGYKCCDALDFLWAQGLLSPWKLYGGDWVAGVLQGVKEELESFAGIGAPIVHLEAQELIWACWNQHLADCLRGPDLRMEKVEWKHRCGRTWRYTEKNGSCDVVVDFTKAKLISDAGKKLEGQKSSRLFKPDA